MSSERNINDSFRNSVDFIGCLSSIMILVLNLWVLHSQWMGLIFFALYAMFISRAISRELTFFDKHLIFPFSFLFFNMLFMIIPALAIGLSVPLSNELLIIFLLAPMLFFIKKKDEKIKVEDKTNVQAKIIRKNYPPNPILLLIFSLSLLGMLFTFWYARTGNTIPYFQYNLNFNFYIFNFIASISAVIFILSRCNLQSKLVIISAYSTVSHIFRYIIYVIPWSSDTWYNLQIAWFLNDGGVLRPWPTLYNYIARGDNAYLSLWGINVSISRITEINLYSIYPYIGILLALFSPLILYQIVKLLINNETYALFTSLMSSFLWETFWWLSLPYANGLGIVTMLFSLLFWILYLKNAKISIFLPLLITLAGILAYPTTGIFVALIAVLSISIRRTGIRKNVAIIGLFSCLILPLIDLFVPIVYPLVSGVRPPPNFLSVDALFNKLIFLSQRSYDSNGFDLNNLLDIPYFVIYLLVIIGILLGRRRIKREIYFLLITFLIGAFFNDVYGWWVQVRVYHRIEATILPWLYLIFASMSFEWVYTKIKEIVPTLRISLNSLSIRRNYSVKPPKIFAISLCIIVGVASTNNFIFAPTTNSYNYSTDMVNAVNYIISQDPSKSSLILADADSILLLSVFSHGRWYNYPYGDRLISVLSLAGPAYTQVLSNPSTTILAVQEGKKSVLDALTQLNITCNMNKFYFVYNTVSVKYIYGSISPDITDVFSSNIGEPKVFGDVYVYSGYIRENTSYGWVTQLNENEAVYDIYFTDFKSLLSKSIVEGQIIYHTNWNDILAFKQNSSLIMKIDVEHEITNATLSYSIYQYNEYNNNFIQVSVDDLNWYTVWKANTTGNYADLNNLKLPPTINGHSSFYLKFCSEKVNDDDGYSMTIRTLWGNAWNGIKLKIYTYK